MSRQRIFRGVSYPDIQHLWDDSSDDEETNIPSNIEMVDLTGTSEPSESSSDNTVIMSISSNELLSLTPPPIVQPYIPRTLQQFSRRYSILSAFPTSFYNLQPSLLMANVPGIFLNIFIN